jgi:hypothetical protein
MFHDVVIHKQNFDLLNLDIHTVYSKYLQSTFYLNVRPTDKSSVNAIQQTLFHRHEKQICIGAEKKWRIELRITAEHTQNVKEGVTAVLCLISGRVACWIWL